MDRYRSRRHWYPERRAARATAVWWSHFERAMLAFDDLRLDELLD